MLACAAHVRPPVKLFAQDLVPPLGSVLRDDPVPLDFLGDRRRVAPDRLGYLAAFVSMGEHRVDCLPVCFFQM